MSCQPAVERTLQNVAWGGGERWSSTWRVGHILRTHMVFVVEGRVLEWVEDSSTGNNDVDENVTWYTTAAYDFGWDTIL